MSYNKNYGLFAWPNFSLRFDEERVERKNLRFHEEPKYSSSNNSVCSHRELLRGNNIWMVETGNRARLREHVMCAIESFATKLPDHCLRYGEESIQN